MIVILPEKKIIGLNRVTHVVGNSKKLEYYKFGYGIQAFLEKNALVPYLQTQYFSPQCSTIFLLCLPKMITCKQSNNQFKFKWR
jgi:hypothetical protein